MADAYIGGAGADLKRCGLATHYVTSSDLPPLETALHDLKLRAHAQGAVDQVLASFEVRLGICWRSGQAIPWTVL